MKKILISLLIIILTYSISIANPLGGGPLGQGGQDQGTVTITGGTIDGITVDLYGRWLRTLPITTGEIQTVLTEAQILRYGRISNQGAAAAETDVKLPALSYEFDIKFEDHEGQGFEVCPPTDEYVRIDSAAAEAANVCVILTAGASYEFYVSRTQDTDGTWYYHAKSFTGALAGGAAD